MLGEFDKARVKINSGLSVSPKDEELLKENKLLIQEENKYYEKHKKNFGKFFGSENLYGDVTPDLKDKGNPKVFLDIKIGDKPV